MAAPHFAFDNSYVRELPGAYTSWQPARLRKPQLLYINQDLAAELGLDLTPCDAATLAATFSGNPLPLGAEPIAQAYAGHQFGHFSPQLGDGRALLIGEVIDRHGKRRDIAFKGSGRTPYSRGGDGQAAIGPMLREALIGEAMHALGIPSTRALAVVATGATVQREQHLPGALLTRVAASHLRVGTFEYYAARNASDPLRRLADYAIARHDPELAGTPTRYLAFLHAVIERQAALVAHWMCVGFIHGVMNTDNMSIAGETIDYGPCAFMEAYAPQTAFSSIDTHGRYAYANQPAMAHWNLCRFAETLLPLLHHDAQQALALATEAAHSFPERYRHHWLAGMRAKLGLGAQIPDTEDADIHLVEDWLKLLQTNQIDFTLSWRCLADAATGQDSPLRKLFSDHAGLDAWLHRWRKRCAAEDALRPPHSPRTSDPADARVLRARSMRHASPWLIPRNHRVEEALAAASDTGDLTRFRQLLAALADPYKENPDLAHQASPAPVAFTAGYRTYCGT